MHIYYDPRRCGAGKTYSKLTEMVKTPSKTIYVMDRIKEIAERQGMIEQLSKQHQSSPHIVVITSAGDSKLTVGEKIEAIPDDFADQDHVIVIIMNQGMKLACFDDRFKDWAMVIDEDISAFETERWNLSVYQQHIDDNYRLDCVGKDIYKIVPRPSCPSTADYRNDSTSGEAMVKFRRLLENQTAFSKEPKFGVQTTWWTIWTFENLSPFREVTILANAFTSKLSYKLAKITTDIEFIPVVSDDDREWRRRKITVRYFAENHRATATTFGSSMGESNLRKIAIWLKSSLANTPHYWCTNRDAPVRLPGSDVGPKTSGRNDLQPLTRCTALYAAKARPEDAASLQAITGGKLGYADVHRDRELEDLAQFVLRGSLRDPNDTQDYEINLYDRQQAEFIRDFLVENRYAVEADVSLVLEHIGIDDPIPTTKATVTRMTEAERKRQQRARDKEAGVKRTHR